MDLVVWLVFVGIALFFDLVMGKAKRQRTQEARREQEQRPVREPVEAPEPYAVEFPYPGLEYEYDVEKEDRGPRTLEMPSEPRRLDDLTMSERARLENPGVDRVRTERPREERTREERTREDRTRVEHIRVERVNTERSIAPEVLVDEVTAWDTRQAQREARMSSADQRREHRLPQRSATAPPLELAPAHVPALRFGREQLILTPGTARHAVVLMEVFGKPKGLV